MPTEKNGQIKKVNYCYYYHQIVNVIRNNRKLHMPVVRTAHYSQYGMPFTPYSKRFVSSKPFEPNELLTLVPMAYACFNKYNASHRNLSASAYRYANRTTHGGTHGK